MSYLFISQCLISPDHSNCEIAKNVASGCEKFFNNSEVQICVSELPLPLS